MDRRKGRAVSIVLWAVIALMAAAYFATWNDAPPALALEALDTAALRTDRLLDLNEATARELEELPGIGPVLAERILAWRAENGPFTSPDDVLAVSGIGPAIYEKIGPYITFP